MGVIVILLTVSCDHKSNCQIRSEPPLKGGDSDDNEEAKKARERFPSMPSPKTNEAGEHAPSFIGEMHPSVVWSQSATYLVVSAKLSNMQKKLASKTVFAFATVPVLS